MYQGKNNDHWRPWLQAPHRVRGTEGHFSGSWSREGYARDRRGSVRANQVWQHLRAESMLPTKRPLLQTSRKCRLATGVTAIPQGRPREWRGYTVLGTPIPKSWSKQKGCPLRWVSLQSSIPVRDEATWLTSLFSKRTTIKYIVEQGAILENARSRCPAGSLQLISPLLYEFFIQPQIQIKYLLLNIEIYFKTSLLPIYNLVTH